jgi:hypothetical protein
MICCILSKRCLAGSMPTIGFKSGPTQGHGFEPKKDGLWVKYNDAGRV